MLRGNRVEHECHSLILGWKGQVGHGGHGHTKQGSSAGVLLEICASFYSELASVRVCREQPSLGSSQGCCSCPGRGVAGLGTSSCESPGAGRGSQTGIDPTSPSVTDPSLPLIPDLWVSFLLKPRWGHS